MKFAMAIIVQVLLGLFLMWGMIKVMHGNWWILGAACVVYLAIFTKAGCSSH